MGCVANTSNTDSESEEDNTIMPLNRLDDGTYVFDFSTLSTFLLCERKAKNRFVRDLESKHVPTKIGFGQAFHAGLAAYYSGYDWKTIERTAIVVAQKTDMAMTMNEDPATSLEACLDGLRRYIVFYAGEPYEVMHTPDGKPMVEILHRMMLSKDPPIAYAMKIDAIVRHKVHGTIHPMDHKTTGRIHDYTQQIRPNHQFTGYLAYAVEHFGDKATSAIMNAIYATPQLKNGKRPLADWFARAETERSEYDFEDWHRTMLSAAKRLIALHESDGYFSMNAPFACHVYKGCTYRDLCSQHDDPVTMEGSYDKSPWRLVEDEV